MKHCLQWTVGVLTAAGQVNKNVMNHNLYFDPFEKLVNIKHCTVFT